MTMWVRNNVETIEIQTEDYGVYKLQGYVKTAAPVNETPAFEEKKGKKKEE